MEKVFFIEKNTVDPLYIQLYSSIKNEIESGQLSGDEKVPSIRQLALNMGISKTTVENAYAQLVAEGYIYSQPQKGYFVTPMKFKRPHEDNIPMDLDLLNDQELSDDYDYDLTGEYVEYKNFDMNLWKQNITRALTEYELELYHMGHPFGEDYLKQQICDYFTRVRGIRAKHHQIIVGSGMQSLLRTLSRFFYNQGYRFLSIENPGFNTAKDVFFKIIMIFYLLI